MSWRSFGYPSLVVVVVWTGSAVGAESVRGDLARLQGKWVTRAGQRGNIEVMMEVVGNRATVNISTHQGLKIKAHGELRLNERTEPRSLDWVGFSGPDNQELPELPAIYRLEGERFRVCNGGFNNPRPATFTPGDGLLADVHLFERVKP